MIARRAFLGALACGATACLGPARAEPRRLPSELAGEVFRLPGRVRLGHPRGDVQLAEFFDYNCAFCRRSMRDIRPLLEAEPDLTYVLINYAVLGVPSIEASRVALAFTLQRTRGSYLDLHERLLSLRGVVDGPRAVREALLLGADRERLIADADGPRVTEALRRAADLGESLGLVATPSFVAGREAVVGYVDLPGKRRVLANLRRCEAMGC